MLVKSRLEGIIDEKHDSLRYYYLGANWQRRVEHVGAKSAADLNGALIVRKRNHTSPRRLSIERANRKRASKSWTSPV